MKNFLQVIARSLQFILRRSAFVTARNRRLREGNIQFVCLFTDGVGGYSLVSGSWSQVLSLEGVYPPVRPVASGGWREYPPVRLVARGYAGGLSLFKFMTRISFPWV